MVIVGILEPSKASKLGYLAFIIPKKECYIEETTDLQSLDKVVICEKYSFLHF